MQLSNARVLHFDLENRPLSYWCDDRPSAEVTAIAWSWADEAKVNCWLLAFKSQDGRKSKPIIELFNGFFEDFHKADMVTGHYIRKHDLPLLNGMLIERNLPTLGQKLTSDTKLDLVKRLDLPASQEALSAYLGVKAPKIQMTQSDWRDANRLTDSGLERTYARCVGDIRQHKENAPEANRAWAA